MGLLDIFKKKETQEPAREPCSVEDVRALLKNPDDFFFQPKEKLDSSMLCRFDVQHKETGEMFEISAFPVKRGPF